MTSDTARAAEATDLLQHLIRNACVNDGTPGSGQEHRSAELLLAKHRNGPTGAVALYFEGEYARYREMERTTDPDLG